MASSFVAPSDLIASVGELDEIYGEPVEAAVIKELHEITDDYRCFIEAAPFVVVSTVGPEGLDCSPRGDPAGFVRVVDRTTLQIPDRRGNNRVDSLRNILRDPRIALLLLIPGVGEGMRVNGRAVLSRNEELRRSFAMGTKVPACVIEVTVESIYPQCRKALVRSRLWDVETQIDREQLPSIGCMLSNITNGSFDGAAYDAAYPQRLEATIY